MKKVGFMTEYPAILRYYVFQIINYSDMGQSLNSLVKAEHNGFEEEWEAENWIQNNGERHDYYTIIKVFKKE